MNVCIKNYRNLTTGFQVTVENVGDVFWGTQCISLVMLSPGSAQTDFE